jgi:hypothetical protein
MAGCSGRNSQLADHSGVKVTPNNPFTINRFVTCGTTLRPGLSEICIHISDRMRPPSAGTGAVHGDRHGHSGDLHETAVTQVHHYFFSALHFLGLSLVPVTVPLIFVFEATLPENCAVVPFTVTLSVTLSDLTVPVTSAGPYMPW